MHFPFRTNPAWLLPASLWLACLASPYYQPLLRASAPEVSDGEVVDNLGDNLMLIHQDQRKHWWFGTWGDGLYLYDGKTIANFTTQHGLAHSRINQILEDSAGNMFFNTPSGISRYDGKQFATLPASDGAEWKLNPGDLWFTNPEFNGKVFRYDGTTLHSLRLPKLKIAEDFLAKHRVLNRFARESFHSDPRVREGVGTASGKMDSNILR